MTKLANRFCEQCDEQTLHDGLVCIHCKTTVEVQVVPELHGVEIIKRMQKLNEIHKLREQYNKQVGNDYRSQVPWNRWIGQKKSLR